MNHYRAWRAAVVEMPELAHVLRYWTTPTENFPLMREQTLMMTAILPY
jgi:hypothetical protein